MQAGPGYGLICGPLEPYAAHVFTTREWQIGQAAGTEARGGGWPEVAAAMDVDVSHLVRLHQVHGATYIVAATPGESLPEADIVLTDREDLALLVQAADCVPLLIADTKGRLDVNGRPIHVVAAAHAGWRGLAARVPERTVQALGREHGSDPADLIVVAGPSIGSCCYEVGFDVRQQFDEAGFGGDALSAWFSTAPTASVRNPPMPGLPPAAREHHWYFDAWRAVRHQLEAAGVPKGSIYCAELCTASHPDWLCSYRRDGVAAGRVAGVIRRRRRP